MNKDRSELRNWFTGALVALVGLLVLTVYSGEHFVWVWFILSLAIGCVVALLGLDDE